MNEHAVSFQEIESLILEKLASGGTVEIKVVGTSMSPFYIDKETTVLIGKSDGHFQKFQVILYKRDKVAVLHRIVRVKPDNLLVLGDAQTKIEAVRPEQVLGVVISHGHKGKVIAENSRKYLFWVWWWHQHRMFRKILLRGWRCLWKRKSKSSSN